MVLSACTKGRLPLDKHRLTSLHRTQGREPRTTMLCAKGQNPKSSTTSRVSFPNCVEFEAKNAVMKPALSPAICPLWTKY
eukprot:9209085-Pyramimonas_sp.AAC.1